MRHLEPHALRTLEAWVEEKFQAVSVEEIARHTDEDEWERLDPWLPQEIETYGRFDRYQGTGEYASHMVVRVTIEDLPSVYLEEPEVVIWSYGEIKTFGFDPTSNAEVAELVGSRLEEMYMDEEISIECLGATAWIPRSNPDSNADGVSRFARLAGACGFFVFNIADKVVLGLDYSIPDPLTSHWAGLFTALTGRTLGGL